MSWRARWLTGPRSRACARPPLRRPIAKVAWRPPAGVRVERILWSAGSGDQPIPVPPVGTDEVVVVSPFIDKNFLARQTPKGTKPARRVLLTTMREIERIGPSLAAFDDLLALDAPDYPISDPEPDPQSAASVPTAPWPKTRKKRSAAVFMRSCCLCDPARSGGSGLEARTRPCAPGPDGMPR